MLWSWLSGVWPRRSDRWQPSAAAQSHITVTPGLFGRAVSCEVTGIRSSPSSPQRGWCCLLSHFNDHVQCTRREQEDGTSILSCLIITWRITLLAKIYLAVRQNDHSFLQSSGSVSKITLFGKKSSVHTTSSDIIIHNLFYCKCKETKHESDCLAFLESKISVSYFVLIKLDDWCDISLVLAWYWN